MDNLESTNSIVIYQTNDGETSIDVKFHDETVWLTQAQMAELFQKDRTVIGRHISNIYKEGELERETTCANFAHVGSDGDQQFFTAIYTVEVFFYVVNGEMLSTNVSLHRNTMN